MTQNAELWFRNEAVVDFDAMAGRLRQILGSDIEMQEVEGGRMFAHKDHVVAYEEGEQGPAITAVLVLDSGEEEVDDSPLAESCQSEVQQSWRCSEAQSLVDQGRHALVVLEMLTRSLGAELRLKLFHATIEAALQECDAEALVFRSSQQVIARDDYLGDLELDAVQRAGALNVRIFQVDGESGVSSVMDTYGMEALGLHDIQCHFRDLAPEDVARALFNTAYYVVEKGAVIEEGNTVNGLEEDQQWVCSFRKSLASPHRRVLDLDPGDPYAAGQRAGDAEEPPELEEAEELEEPEKPESPE